MKTPISGSDITEIQLNFPNTIDESRKLAHLLYNIGNYQTALTYLIHYYLITLDNKDEVNCLDALTRISRYLIDCELFSECKYFLNRAMGLAANLKDFDAITGLMLYESEMNILTGFHFDAETRLSDAQNRLASWYNSDHETIILLQKATLFRTSGYVEKAISLAHKSLEKINDINEQHLIVKAYLNLARAFAEKKVPAEAQKYYNLAIHNSDIAGNYFYLAQIYLETGNFIGSELEKSRSDLVVDDLRPPAWFIGKAYDIFQEYGTIYELEKVLVSFRRFGRRLTDQMHTVETDEKCSRLAYFQQRSSRQLLKLLFTNLHAWEAMLTVKHLPLPAISGYTNSFLQHFINENIFLIKKTTALNEIRESVAGISLERKRLSEIAHIEKLLAQSRTVAELLKKLTENICELINSDGTAFIPSKAIYNTGNIISRDVHFDWTSRCRSLKRVTLEQLLPLAEKTVSRTDGWENHEYVTTTIRGLDDEFGILYCDKHQSHGTFNAIDLKILQSICLRAGLYLDNLLKSEKLSANLSVSGLILDNVSDGIITLDESLRINSVNKTAESLLSLDADGLLGRNASILGLDFRFEQPIKPVEQLLFRRGKSELSLTVKILHDPNSRPCGILIIINEPCRKKQALKLSTLRPSYNFDYIIGSSKLFISQIEMARMASRVDSDVLITGESGTGKEVFAQSIHNASSNSSGPFVGINCAAIPGELLESELFGYEEGAFTGARKGGQVGKFELAESGTILLDEIGDMPMEMQVKLLRVLQERTFRRVGGSLEYVFNCRVISTTNRNLDDMVNKNLFRQDLLYRLKVMHITIPSLRERPTDIIEYINFFIDKFNYAHNRNIKGFSSELLDVLTKYNWPGNVRELQHFVETECTLLAIDENTISHLKSGFSVDSGRHSMEPATGTLRKMEEEIFRNALAENNGNASKTARALGISRGTVYNYMKKFNLESEEFKNR
ncbi:sigma 54-interacting transcriptional regulator [Myxococcota bacterium]|nr:sigma 54-interacting transcriptional regulator [Myxococcota bacterium]MBU1497541.1 sigma 54-interacting transcriptional regulator [Myxococcota bacterium]